MVNILKRLDSRIYITQVTCSRKNDNHVFTQNLSKSQKLHVYDILGTIKELVS